MTLAKDKRQHLVGGAMVAVGTLVLLWLAQRFSAAVAMAAAGAVVGFGFEALQKFRGEGVPELGDALFTTAGACLAAAGAQWLWPILQRWL